MSSMQQSVVKQASTHFRKGEYDRAKACYQKAGEIYGTELFANSIRLCELRMRTPKRQLTDVPATVIHKKPQEGPVSTDQQLMETQKLLEHFYTRCQELEYQLLDRK